jgi:DNA polymerase I-like protein with 3'-5' exonuclease and polymerase domains
MLFEADFSQLEIVGVALLSGDEVLKNDIRSGADLHRMRAAELFHIPELMVTASQRKLAKALSFQLQYGAGPKSMAATNKIPLATAKRFVELYYARYKRLKFWQDEVMLDVKLSRSPTGTHTPKGYPRGRGTHHSATGRIYTFLEQDSDYAPGPNFSPTEVKNYPVQGYATGDIMAVFRHMVWRELMRNGHLLDYWAPINTIHDSIMFDLRTEHEAQTLVYWLEMIVKDLPTLLQSLWPGVKIDLPFKIECKAGPTWAKMAPINGDAA